MTADTDRKGHEGLARSHGEARAHEQADERDGAAAPALQIEEVRALAQVMKDFDLTEVELRRTSGDRIYLNRGASRSRQTGVTLLEPAIAAADHGAGRAGGAALHAGGAAAHATAAAPAPSGASAATSAGQPPVGQNIFVVSAPLVGTFYRSPSPDAPSFVDVGQRVRKGQTLCIIEAMKLMNELESEVDGIVAACLADNGRPVEYGQPLFHIQRL